MQLFDSHCHLDCVEFDVDRAQVLARCKALGLVGIVLPGVAAAGWDKLLSTAAADPIYYPTLGLHPMYVSEHEEVHLARLEREIALHSVVAIGEIGLDFFVDGLDRDRQLELFKAQLAIAATANLPVVLHVRKAHDEVLACLRRAPGVRGVVHAFGGSEQQARVYIDLGFKLGFGGAMTYDRALKLRRLAHDLPLSSILLETDAPDIPTSAHSGERNSPEYLPEILACLAELRGETSEHVAAQTTRNALELYSISP